MYIWQECDNVVCTPKSPKEDLNQWWFAVTGDIISGAHVELSNRISARDTVASVFKKVYLANKQKKTLNKTEMDGRL